MGSLGSPEQYEVWIVDAYGSLGASGIDTAAEPLLVVEWSEIGWGRIENDVSTATVTVPTSLVTPGFGRGSSEDPSGTAAQPMPLRAWLHWVHIYRDSVLVWRGPIVGWSGPVLGGPMEIVAADVVAYAKRRMVQDVSFAAADLWDVVSGLVTSIGSGGEPWMMLDPESLNPGETAGITLTRDYLYSERLYLFDVLQDLVGQGLWFSAGPVAVSYDRNEFLYTYFNMATTVAVLTRPAPTLNEQTVLNNPKATVDGRDLTIKVFADSTDLEGVVSTAQLTIDPAMDQTYAQADPTGEFETVVRGEGGYDTGEQARRLLATNIFPTVAVEPVLLGPKFGSFTGWGTEGSAPTVSTVSGVAGFAGINDLRPGLVARWGFDVPHAVNEAPVGRYAPGLDTYWTSADEMDYVWLSKVDVKVSKQDGDVVEQIWATFTPTVVS